MHKLTVLFVASILTLSTANLTHTAGIITVAPADVKPMTHRKGKFGPHQGMMSEDLNPTDVQK